MRVDSDGKKNYSGYEDQFVGLDRETQIVEALGVHGLRIFLGNTDTASRMKNVRAAILDMGFGLRPMNPAKLGRLNFSTAFEKTYGEPLIRSQEAAA